MKKLKPYDMIHANMVCPKCGKKVDTLLLVNKQGMIRVDTYICSDCFIVMEREIPEHYRAGHLKATEKHLEDMRTIAFGQLKKNTPVYMGIDLARENDDGPNTKTVDGTSD